MEGRAGHQAENAGPMLDDRNGRVIVGEAVAEDAK